MAIRNGYWSAASQLPGGVTCDSAKSFVCKKTLDPIPTTPPPPTFDGVCDVGFVNINDYCYYVNPGWTDETVRSWHEANVECGHRGAELASFHSKLEIEYFIESLNNTPMHNLFIGLYSNGFDGWKWSDETAVDYFNWNWGEPNGLSGGECVEMYPWSGTWNDVSCYESRGYVCKKPTEYTRCLVPYGLRYECGFPDITEQYCVSTRRCCWDPTLVNANFSGCYYEEGFGPSGIPITDNGGLSGGAVAGIVIGALVAVALVIFVIYYFFVSSGRKMPSVPAFSVPSFKSKPATAATPTGGFDNPMTMPEKSDP